MRWGRFVCIVVVAASCRPPVALQKEAPFDFQSHPGPASGSLNSEATILDDWKEGGALRTFWDGGEAGSFVGVDGIEIVYRIHRAANPKGAVVILPGRTEAIIKFAEVANDLVKQGYSTYALTLRGQGEAGRILSDRNKGYVAWFDDYVTDTHRFVVEHVAPDGLPTFMLSHSTGGAVAVLLNDAYPGDLQALAFTSPMLEIDLGSYPQPVAATLGLGICNSTDGSGYILGGGPYTREEGVATSTVTHSENRWAWKMEQLDGDESLRMGAPTWRWLCQSLDASSRGEGLGKFTDKPMLMLQAGEDTIVKPGGQERFCSAAPRCTLETVAGSRHEILQESDAQRNLAVGHVIAFFDAQVAK